jgi:hypothetical protein
LFLHVLPKNILQPVLSDRRLFSTNEIIRVRLVLMRGDRAVDSEIGGIKYNYDKRMIIMAIALDV